MKPFPWRAGMAATIFLERVPVRVDAVHTFEDGAVWLMGTVRSGEAGPRGLRTIWTPVHHATPIKDDPATLGAFRAATREARGEPRGFVLPPGALTGGWAWVANANTSPLDVEGDGYATEFEAIDAAWQQAPTRVP